MRNVKNVNICMYELFGLNYLPITDFVLTCHKKKQTLTKNTMSLSNATYRRRADKSYFVKTISGGKTEKKKLSKKN